jgi:phosphoglycolate phosphatase-like HAD superfamily hydrolase
MAVRWLIFSLQPEPLIVASMPGSKSAAQLFATMYERRFGVLTRCCDLDELTGSLPFLGSSSVLLFAFEPETAEAIHLLENCIAHEPRKLGVLCRADTAFGRIAREAGWVTIAEPSAADDISSGSFTRAAVFERAFFGTEPTGTSPTFIDSRVAAIRRKTRSLGASLRSDEIPDAWMRRLDDQIQKLNHQSFRALVLDYDGTLLCPPAEEPARGVIDRLELLLRNGMVLGIATGRDPRIATRLRRVFRLALQEQIWLGCANGAEICRLIDPIESCDELCAELRPVKAALESDPILRHAANIKCTRQQLTISSKGLFSRDALWRIANLHARRSGGQGIRTVATTYSVDILAPGASKLNLFAAIYKLGIHPHEILCIGDQGRWPGNDFELLEHEFALSVDETSECWSCGWNLAPRGYRGPRATLYYLETTAPSAPGYFRLRLPAK